MEDEERVVEEEQKQDGDQLDFGSLVIDDVPLPSPSQASIDGANGSQLQFGTTVFHDAHFPADEQQRQNESYQAGSILFSPAKKRTSSHGLPHSFPSSPNAAPSPGQQLAMAAAAFKKDLLHDTEDSHVEGGQADPSTSIQVKPTPVNRLQSLFMQTASSASDKAAAASASPPEAAQERSSNSDAEEQHQSQATQSSEYLEEAEQASCIADQQLEDIPGPSFEVDSLHASSHNVEVNNNSNAETEKTRECIVTTLWYGSRTSDVCISYRRSSY